MKKISLVTVTLLFLFVAPNVMALGGIAPDFTLPIVDSNGLTGKNVTLSSFKGSPVILEFTEPWCDACKTMVPTLKTLRQNNFGLIDFVMISVSETTTTAHNAN